MKFTARDKWLLMVLPALFTAMVYVYFSGFAASQAMNAARVQAQAAQASVPPPGAVAAAQNTLQELSEKLSAEKQRSANLLAAKSQLVSAGVERRTDALRMLSQIVAQHQLSLLKSEQLKEPGGKNVPPSCAALCKRMSEHFALSEPEFWRLKLRGSYQNMLDVLQALGRSALFIVPVSIGMEPLNTGDGELEWSLTAWI